MEIKLGKKEEKIHKNYIIELREVNGPNIVVILNNYSIFHLLTKTNIFNLKSHLTFTFNNRYLLETFQGIMPNSRAASILTAEEPQFIAFQKLDPTV